MLSDVVRVLRSSIRSLLAILVDLNRSQLLESNRSLNRLGHRLINNDLNNNVTVSRLRSKGLLALTQNALAISLRNQLSLKGVFLTRNQTLIGHRIVDLRTSNNLSCTISKISIRRNLRLNRFIGQAWLIYRNHRLGTRSSILIGMHNGDIRIGWLLRNLYSRIFHELRVINKSFNLITRKLGKFFVRTGKRRKILLIILHDSAGRPKLRVLRRIDEHQ